MGAPRYQPNDEDRQGVSAAVAAAGQHDVAVVRAGDGWLFARGRAGSGPLGSAVFRLVVGVYESLPRAAHETLRGRILCSSARTRLDHEIVKVTAGKLRASVERSPQGFDPVSIRDVESSISVAIDRVLGEGLLPLDGDASPAERVARLRRLLHGLPAERVGARHRRDRRIVAAAYDSEGAPLGAARNLNGRNRTLHAEINLLLGWWARERRPLPARSHVITSQKPCRMCAAALIDATEGGRPSVTFIEDDGGRYARSTALDELGLLRQA